MTFKSNLICAAIITLFCSFTMIAQAAENNIEFYPINQNSIVPSWIITNIPQGENRSFTVEINNPTDQTVIVELNYKEATQNGDNFLPKTTEGFENIGKWVDLPIKKRDLKPGEKYRFNYQVTVPKNAPPQNYLGAIYASTTQKSDTINLVTQIGIRNYITITPARNSIIKFLDHFQNPTIFTLILSAIGLIASILYNFMHKKQK